MHYSLTNIICLLAVIDGHIYRFTALKTICFLSYIYFIIHYFDCKLLESILLDGLEFDKICTIHLEYNEIRNILPPILMVFLNIVQLFKVYSVDIEYEYRRNILRTKRTISPNLIGI